MSGSARYGRSAIAGTGVICMTKTFKPAPFDKHAVDPKEALKRDAIVDQHLNDGVVGGSFPASDPLSATQPSPSPFDSKTE